MGRKRGPGGGKSERTLTYKPTVDGLALFEQIRAERIAEMPALANVAISDWVGDFMGFTSNNLCRPCDRLRLRFELTESEREQVNNLGEVAELWGELPEREQKLYAVRIESLLRDVRAKVKSNGGSAKESSRSAKQTRQAVLKRADDLKTKSA